MPETREVMGNVRITSTQFSSDMAGWGCEKASITAESIAAAVDILRIEGRGMSPETREELNSLLHKAVNGTTKMLAFFAGADWEATDAKDVFEHGMAAYERVAKRYGIEVHRRRGKRDAEEEEQYFKEFVSQLLPLVNSERGQGRTPIHDLLRRYRCIDPRFSLIEQLTESVTMGQLSWAQYQRTVRELVSS